MEDYTVKITFQLIMLGIIIAILYFMFMFVVVGGAGIGCFVAIKNYCISFTRNVIDQPSV